MKRGAHLAASVLTLVLVTHLSGQTSVPEIPFDSAAAVLKMPPDIHLGEVAGIATNSKGQLFVYTRTGNPTAGLGNSRLFTHGGSRLFEFARNGAFVREIGQGLYGLLVAHAVRVDTQDNIWVVDEGSNQVIKFSPDGRVLMVLGRKPEAVSIRTTPAGSSAPAAGRGTASASGAGGAGDQFLRPSDVAFDGEGNIFVADGHGGNARVQVFDNDLNFKAIYDTVGNPWAVCISPGPHQYLFVSNSIPDNGLAQFRDITGEIYKMELDGTIVGRFGKAGKQLKEFSTTHEIDCRNPNELFIAQITAWRIQKIILRPRPERASRVVRPGERSGR